MRQIALGAVGVDMSAMFPPSAAAGVLAGIAVLFGGIAIRRLARVG